jgi:hypothetical protein
MGCLAQGGDLFLVETGIDLAEKIKLLGCLDAEKKRWEMELAMSSHDWVIRIAAPAAVASTKPLHYGYWLRTGKPQAWTYDGHSRCVTRMPHAAGEHHKEAGTNPRHN